MIWVRLSYPTTRFEVLYPRDVNDTALNLAINFPHDTWTAADLDCLKTENFTPLEPDVREEKYYCAGVGLVLEVSVTGGKERNELVSITPP